jgi:NAD(P)-dependent dehydrogenase (short-subunit alcohol dehydrogenase family)
MGFKWPEELIFIPNGKLPHKKTDELMTDKVCVVSGSSSGVGYETIKQLAKGKAHIVMVVRNKEKAEKIKEELVSLYNVQIDIYIADFSKLEDVRRVASEILRDYKKIDVLINSVGIHSTKKLYNEDGMEMCFVVNHLSVFLFTYLLMNRLKENEHARIIQVNSEGHRFSGVKLKDVHFRKRIYTGLLGYGQSKTAQLLTTWEFDKWLEGCGVTINAMHPGAVKTAIGSNNGWLYRTYFKYVTSRSLKDPVISGESIYYLAASKEMEGISGKFFHLTTEELPAKHALDETTSKLVWDLSKELVGIK